MVKCELRVAVTSCELHLICELRVASCELNESCELETQKCKQVETKVRVIPFLFLKECVCHQMKL